MLLQGYEWGICPMMQHWQGDSILLTNHNNQDQFKPLYDEFRTKFNVANSSLNIEAIDNYTDAYWATWFNGNETDLTQKISSEALNLIPKQEGLLYYDGWYSNDLSARVVATDFFRLLNKTF